LHRLPADRAGFMCLPLAPYNPASRTVKCIGWQPIQFTVLVLITYDSTPFFLDGYEYRLAADTLHCPCPHHLRLDPLPLGRS
jgi:hypothetical protein